MTYNDYLKNIKPTQKPQELIKALERISEFEKTLTFMVNAVREADGRIIGMSDYDTDGTMSELILDQKYHFDEVHIADRYKDGYGIPNDLSFLKEGDLVILSDIGSDSVDKLKEICERTKTTPFVIDHHEMSEELKAYLSSDALIKPMFLNFYDGTLDKDKTPDWCSSGLCYNLVMSDEKSLSNRQKDLIAVYNMNGTIGDVVKVNNPYDTNREDILKGFHIVEEMTTDFEPKFGALLYKAGITEKPHMTTEAVQFNLSPITTLGKRMESMKGNMNITESDRCNVGQIIFNMLRPDIDWETRQIDFNSEYFKNALKNAIALKDLNDTRKAELKKFEGKEYNDFIKNFLKEQAKGSQDGIVIYVNEKIPMGYTGLIAMDLTKDKNLKKPAIVFTKDRDGNYVASGRNIDGYPDLLAMCKNEYALHIGGHTGAYGVTVTPENLKKYIETVQANYKGLKVEVKKPMLDSSEIKEMTIPKLLALEPFGTDFPKVEAFNELIIGSKTGKTWNTVTNADYTDKTRYFGLGIEGEQNDPVWLRGTMGVNFFAGIENVQMNVAESGRGKDFREMDRDRVLEYDTTPQKKEEKKKEPEIQVDIDTPENNKDDKGDKGDFDPLPPEEKPLIDIYPAPPEKPKKEKPKKEPKPQKEEPKEPEQEEEYEMEM